MERKPMPTPLTLSDQQLFVYGAPASGHLSAGSAGIAMRGDWRNNAQTDEAFQTLLRRHRPEQPASGHFTTYGLTQGPGKGEHGKSYAIMTTLGTPRSVPLKDGSHWNDQLPGKWRAPLSDLHTQLLRLCAFAREKSDLEFLVPHLACGASGYTPAELDALWDELDVPENLTFIELER